MKILNFGSLNIDYIYQVKHFVQPGETLQAESQQVKCGGKGLNQSIAMAKAGCRTFHAGCIGAGGERLLMELKKNHVDTTYIRAIEELQGNAVIQVSRTGENCILLYGGSNQAITAKQVQETLSQFGSGDFLVLQNETNALPQLLETAEQRGMRIVLNPSPFTDSLSQMDFHAVEWFLVNEIEAEQMTGETDPDLVWERFSRRYPDARLVMTMGKQGAFGFTKEERIHQAAYPATAVDTTAAGDTFTGYFIAALVEGRPLAECMRLGALAASISVTRPGAAESIPWREEVRTDGSVDGEGSGKE